MKPGARRPDSQTGVILTRSVMRTSPSSSPPPLSILIRGGDEGAEQRVRVERLALELRVELAARNHGESVLDDLDELLVRRQPRHLQAGLDEPPQVLLVDLVTVACLSEISVFP